MMYYGSTDYDAKGQASLKGTTLIGSAVCTTYDWVVCLDCTENQFNDDRNERSRFALADDGTILVQQNLCNGVVYETVITNYVSLFFITVVMILLSVYWGAREVRFDEDK